VSKEVKEVKKRGPKPKPKPNSGLKDNIDSKGRGWKSKVSKVPQEFKDEKAATARSKVSRRSKASKQLDSTDCESNEAEAEDEKLVTKKRTEKIKYEPLISLNYVNKALKRKEAMTNLFGAKRHKMDTKSSDTEIEVIGTTETETISKGYLSCNIMIRKDFESKSGQNSLFDRLKSKFSLSFLNTLKNSRYQEEKSLDDDSVMEIGKIDDFEDLFEQETHSEACKDDEAKLSKADTKEGMKKELVDEEVANEEKGKKVEEAGDDDEFSDFLTNDEEDNFLATFNPVIKLEDNQDKSTNDGTRYSLESVIRMINTP